MERLTFEGNFCDIAQCQNVPGGSFCESGNCSQKRVWERLKEYEDAGLTPEEIQRLEAECLEIYAALMIRRPPQSWCYVEETGCLF